MDDAFRMVAPKMPRTRRLTAFDVKLIVLSTVAIALIAVFAAFVMSQQLAADVRRARTLANEQAAASAQALADADGSAVSASALDRQAQGAATDALRAATQLGSPEAATTAALTGAVPGVLFVDGPSTAPTVVSIYSGAAGWAAAVRGSGGTCFWVAMSDQGNDRYGTGTGCTGLDALSADQPSW
jgi:hypothetical protein